MEAIVCLLDSARGIYIPQNFAELFDADEWGISEEEVEILLDGPDNELYWETWDCVISYAEYTDANGNTFRLHQDGDLFAYCIERMSPEEQRDFFGDY